MKPYERIYQSQKWLNNDYDSLSPIAFVNFPPIFLERMLLHIQEIKEYLPQSSRSDYVKNHFNHLTFFYDYKFDILPVELEQRCRKMNVRLVKFSLDNIDSMSIFMKHSQIFVHNIWHYRLLNTNLYQSVIEEVQTVLMGFLKHFEKLSNRIYFILPDIIFKPSEEVIYKANNQANNDETINSSLQKFISDSITFYNKFFKRNCYRFIIPFVAEMDRNIQQPYKLLTSPYVLRNIIHDFIPMEFFTLWFLEKYINNTFESKDYLLNSNIRVSESTFMFNIHERNKASKMPNVQKNRIESNDFNNIIEYLPSKLFYKSFNHINFK